MPPVCCIYHKQKYVMHHKGRLEKQPAIFEFVELCHIAHPHLSLRGAVQTIVVESRCPITVLLFTEELFDEVQGEEALAEH